MDTTFLNDIITATEADIVSEKMRHYQIRKEAQLRRIMSWYNVGREDAARIQAEMGYPFLGSPVQLHNKPDGVEDLLTLSGVYVELYFLIVIRKGMPYDLTRFLDLVEYHHSRARYNHLIRISFDFWYIMHRVNLKEFFCHPIDR